MELGATGELNLIWSQKSIIVQAISGASALPPLTKPEMKKGRALSSAVPHLTSWLNYFLTFAFVARAAEP